MSRKTYSLQYLPTLDDKIFYGTGGYENSVSGGWHSFKIINYPLDKKDLILKNIDLRITIDVEELPCDKGRHTQFFDISVDPQGFKSDGDGEYNINYSNGIVGLPMVLGMFYYPPLAGSPDGLLDIYWDWNPVFYYFCLDYVFEKA